MKPTAQALALLLGRISFDEYKAGLHSHDPVILADVVYPLERAFEVANNYVIELVELALEELGVTPVEGPRNLELLTEAGVITTRLAEQLADIHRARNQLSHDLPDLGASILYPACEELVKVLPAFFRAYGAWLRERGYGASSR
jgi:uncharacterized protein YutE (UPF0331/DUF86 family)